ncbi:hypothetical protein [Anaplasma marginale]|nr:hypothetical protein [Anaplasma marginale]
MLTDALCPCAGVRCSGVKTSGAYTDGLSSHERRAVGTIVVRMQCVG